MAETGTPEAETLTLGEFARKRGIDSALLRLLAEGGHIDTSSARRGSHRLPADCSLTAEQAEAKGRAAYNEVLEATGRQVMKTQSRMRRLLAELEDQQNNLHEIVPLGPGLLSVIDRAFGHSDEKWDLVQAVHDLVAWNEVLSNIDDRHRVQEDTAADTEMFQDSTIPWESRIAIGRRSTGPRARMERRSPPTPLADELPDGVDDLSPEARRTVLDLLRVLVVAETGGRRR